MSQSEHTGVPRPMFGTLFADPRHYRGDLRLMRMAIRRGWLNDVPQATRDALVARFEQARAERRASDPEQHNNHALAGECLVLFTMIEATLSALERAMRSS